MLRFFVVGYLLTVMIELPILWFGLSPGHSRRSRILAGFWLTSVTYPIVVLVLPPWFDSRWTFLVVAETFAPVAESALFVAAFPARRWKRDCLTIIGANLVSFGVGELLHAWHLLDM